MDGISITLFKTLIRHYDASASGGSVNIDEILGTIADFFIVGFGSILINIGAFLMVFEPYFANYVPSRPLKDTNI